MNKGFTLVELIAVISILALLVIITTPAYDAISKNIKTRNYNSKITAIKSETLSYIEKHLKDKVYSGVTDKGKRLCFTVDFLIKNGIVSSDSDTDEYIKNDTNGIKYNNDSVLLQVLYDYKNLKLVALAENETKKIYDDIDNTKDIIFEFENTECSVNNTY